MHTRPDRGHGVLGLAPWGKAHVDHTGALTPQHRGDSLTHVDYLDRGDGASSA